MTRWLALALAATLMAACASDAARQTPSVQGSPQAPPTLGASQELTDLDGWLQSDIESLEALRGRVVIVHFWTFGCINCKHTLPNLIDLYDDHHADGLEIVGVHAPEFSYEKDPDAIATAADDLGVTWPIALDTRRTNFHQWQIGRRVWPRTFVVDQAGRIRFDRLGEGGYKAMRDTVEYLLASDPNS